MTYPYVLKKKGPMGEGGKRGKAGSNNHNYFSTGMFEEHVDVPSEYEPMVSDGAVKNHLGAVEALEDHVDGSAKPSQDHL